MLIERKIQEIKNRINFLFLDLQFEEDIHRYTHEGLVLPSVSSNIKEFEENIDWEEKAYYVGLRDGKTTEEVLSEWAEKRNRACADGHDVHDFAERYGKGEVKSHKTCAHPKKEAVVSFFNDLDHKRYIPVFFELRMMHFDFGYAGTTDLVLYDKKEDSLIIADYKTNSEDLFKNYKGKTMLEPFEDMLDSPYNHYQVQLSSYQMMLEQTGYQISDRWLIHLKDDSTYHLHKTYDFTKRLTDHYKNRVIDYYA